MRKWAKVKAVYSKQLLVASDVFYIVLTSTLNSLLRTHTFKLLCIVRISVLLHGIRSGLLSEMQEDSDQLK